MSTRMAQVSMQVTYVGSLVRIHVQSSTSLCFNSKACVMRRVELCVLRVLRYSDAGRPQVVASARSLAFMLPHHVCSPACARQAGDTDALANNPLDRSVADPFRTLISMLFSATIDTRRRRVVAIIYLSNRHFAAHPIQLLVLDGDHFQIQNNNSTSYLHTI